MSKHMFNMKSTCYVLPFARDFRSHVKPETLHCQQTLDHYFLGPINERGLANSDSSTIHKRSLSSENVSRVRPFLESMHIQVK